MRHDHFSRAGQVLHGLPRPGNPSPSEFVPQGPVQREQNAFFSAENRDRLMVNGATAKKCRRLLLERIAASAVPDEALRLPGESFIARFLGVFKSGCRKLDSGKVWDGLELSAFQIAKAMGGCVTGVKMLLRWLCLGPVRNRDGVVVGVGLGIIAAERRGGALPDGRFTKVARTGRKLRAILRSSLRWLTSAGCALLNVRGEYGGEHASRAPLKLGEWFRKAAKRVEDRENPDPRDVWIQAHRDELAAQALAGVPPAPGSVDDYKRGLAELHARKTRDVLAGEDTTDSLWDTLGRLLKKACPAAAERTVPPAPTDPPF